MVDMIKKQVKVLRAIHFVSEFEQFSLKKMAHSLKEMTYSLKKMTYSLYEMAYSPHELMDSLKKMMYSHQDVVHTVPLNVKIAYRSFFRANTPFPGADTSFPGANTPHILVNTRHFVANTPFPGANTPHFLSDMPFPGTNISHFTPNMQENICNTKKIIVIHTDVVRLTGIQQDAYNIQFKTMEELEKAMSELHKVAVVALADQPDFLGLLDLN